MSGNDLEDKVDKDVCKILHKQVDEKFAEHEKKFITHDEKLDDLKDISNKLTWLVEQQKDQITELQKSRTQKDEKQEERSYDKKARIIYPVIASTCSTLIGFILGVLLK